ncbi:MAG: putative rane protein [Mycobacterium sp.]|nr:putative rane protein [Mycobacterium sp.]
MSVTRRSETQISVGHRHLGGGRETVEHPLSGSAARFAAAVVVAAVGFLIVAALWVSTCTEALDVDTAACGVPQRTFLGLGAPLILFAGAVWAFLSTYRAWRAKAEFWTWQGAAWFLFTAMLVTSAMGFPALAGPAFGG